MGAPAFLSKLGLLLGGVSTAGRPCRASCYLYTSSQWRS